MERDDAYIILSRIFSGEISAEEKIKIEQWMAAAPENRLLYEEVERLLVTAVPPPRPPLPDIDSEWRRLAGELRFVLDRKPHAVRAKPGASYWKRLAATFQFSGMLRPAMVLAGSVLFLAVAVLLWQFLYPAGTIEYSTVDSRDTVTLPDGSYVELNHHSRIRLSRDFSGAYREVELQGEAYFEVKNDPGHPFRVSTASSQLEVLGTRFNVRARQAETQVVVTEGRVALKTKFANADAPEVQVHSGEMSRVIAGQPPAPPRPVETDRLLGWREGKIVFYQTDLPEIASELSQIFATGIRLEVPGADTLSVTGTFERQSLPNIIHSICLTLSLEYREEGDYIVLFVKE